MIANLSPRRLWAIVGFVGAVLIVAVGYFFFISSEKSSTANLLSQAADAQTQAAVGHAKVAELRKDNEKLARYKSQLDELEKAIPTGASTAQFVSDMQRLGQRANLKITAINITPPDPNTLAIAPVAPTDSTGATATTTTPAPSTPTPAPTDTAATTGTPTSAPVSTLTPLNITVTADGATADLERFLSLLQDKEPRALLLGHVTESAGGPSGSGSGSAGSADAAKPTITISMTAFFATA